MKHFAGMLFGLIVLAVPYVAGANPMHTRLSQFSDTQRNEVLSILMRQSDEPCFVVRNFFQGFDDQRNAYWNVACSNKKAFQIKVNNDTEGSTKILDCAMPFRVECFKRFDAQ